MSSQLAVVNDEQSTLILEVIDASLRITRRDQFFSWLQGACQYLIPHEVLMCGFRVDGEENLHYESFISTRYVNEELVKRVTENKDGIVNRALVAWNADKRPILVADGLAAGDHGNYVVPFVETPEHLREIELKNLAAHGLQMKDGSVSSFFCFSRIIDKPNANHAYLLELLVPHLHAILMRFVGIRHDRATAGKKQLKGPVTKRELDILKWLHLGKTNQEIAMILEISPLTVKNHIHSILNKLHVENRSLASSKAVQLGLLKI